MQNKKVEWNYTGKTDYSFGTGAESTEKWLGTLASFIVPIYLIYQLMSGTMEWGILQTIVAFLIAFDVSGGLVSNALNSCKRFYHAPLKKEDGRLAFLLKNHLFFSLIHIHPIIVGLVYGNSNWLYGLTWYGIFMLSVFLVQFTPLYLKRPVAMMLIMIAILLNFGLIEAIVGFEWLIPLLFLKIIYGHLVQEEPYRR